MHRTTIMLPDDLRNRAVRRAKETGVSLGELIRQAVETLLSRSRSPAREDPLFRDAAVYDGEAPSDSTQNHDRYLYGEES